MSVATRKLGHYRVEVKSLNEKSKVPLTVHDEKVGMTSSTPDLAMVNWDRMGLILEME